ncbi:ABC transporter permease [Enterococcus larvae]|uniref:ABC transporter permease n=1 Tax=Enterococcus larvae TaxID=2794352 RepID=UPI003F30FEC6
MFRLIKLELKRNRLKPYITAAVVITVAMLALVYLFAIISYLDTSDTDLLIFMTYRGISTLSLIVATACFSILSSVMYNKFVIEEYTSKKVFLLFSYPVERKRVLWAKILTVFLFTIVSMMVSGLVIFSIFFITESLLHLSQDTLTIQVISEVIFSLIGFSIIAAAFGVISLWLGYWRKSTSVTIISGVIVSSVFGSFSSELLLAKGTSSITIVAMIAVIVVLFAFALIIELSNKINVMEV